MEGMSGQAYQNSHGLWFVWKRKSIALTGHSGKTRLFRSVRTLRYYMEMVWLVSGKIGERAG